LLNKGKAIRGDRRQGWHNLFAEFRRCSDYRFDARLEPLRLTTTYATVIHERHESCHPPGPVENLVPASRAAQTRKHILQVYELYEAVKNGLIVNKAKAIMRDFAKVVSPRAALTTTDLIFP